MRIGMGINYAGGFKETAEEVIALEKAGLDIVWVAEAYSFDSVTAMGYLAAVTEHVQIGSSIVNIYSRTPTTLAMTAAGLDYVSDGRAILGIGASGPQVIEGFHGVAYDKPIGRTREIVDICRKVWRRERLTNDGIYTIPLPPEQGTGLGKPLKIINHLKRPDIPIYIASLGDKNVEMTAEVAEGWLPLFYIPERAASVWAEPLAAGAAKRSSELPPLEVVAGGIVAVVDDADAAKGLLDMMRPMIALYVGGMGAKGRNFYNALACKYGYEKEAAEIQDLYLGGEKDKAAALVPQEMLELTNLVGPEGYIKDRIAAFKESGVTILNVTPVGGDKVALVEQLKSWM
jgi:F420-dependent oxidoreductase-like protein